MRSSARASPEAGTPPLATAEVASIGVASGAVALDPEAVKRASEASAPAILVRQETVTTDIEGMALAAGILTATGGRTSHAAVVARQLGKVCLVACPGLEIDLHHRQCRIGDALVNEGDFLSLDGNTGAVRLGRLEPLTGTAGTGLGRHRRVASRRRELTGGKKLPAGGEFPVETGSRALRPAPNAPLYPIFASRSMNFPLPACRSRIAFRRFLKSGIAPRSSATAWRSSRRLAALS